MSLSYFLTFFFCSGAHIWHAVGLSEEHMAPDAEDASKRVPTMMTTADMAMREDPEYRKISERFHKNMDQFQDAFARAWFKLLHRDLGPKTRYLGPEAPKEELIWQVSADFFVLKKISLLKKLYITTF